MADVTVTAANVVPAAGANVQKVTAGATVTAGQAVYKDATASSKAKPCDADAEASAVCAGIALSSASLDQPLFIATGGDVGFGAIFTVGTTYCVSTTAGGIAPEADLTTGDYKSILGVATTTSNLRLNIFNSGVAEA